MVAAAGRTPPRPRRIEVALDHRAAHRRLSIVCRPGRVELRVGRVLCVAEHEDDLAGLAGLELELDVVRAARRPAVGDRVAGAAVLDDDRPVPAAVRAEERVALRVEAGERRPSRRSRRSGRAARGTRSCGRSTPSSTSTSPIERLRWKFVASSHASQRQNSTALKSESRAGVVAPVGDPRPPDLERLAERDEVERLRLDARPARADHRVAEPVAAAVVLEVARGSAARTATSSRRVVGVAEVEVAAADVERRVVVAVAREPAQPGVAEERVAAGRVRDDPEEAPRCRGS